MQHHHQLPVSAILEAAHLEFDACGALEKLARTSGLRIPVKNVMAAIGWPIRAFSRFVRCIVSEKEFLRAVAKLGWVYDGRTSFVRVGQLYSASTGAGRGLWGR